MMVINDPDQNTIYDLFFELDIADNGDRTIASTYSREFSTINDALYGSPTRVLNMK